MIYSVRTQSICRQWGIGISCEILRRKDHVVLKFQRSRIVSLEGLEIDDEVGFNRKYRVGFQVWVVFGEYLGCDGFVVLLTYLAAEPLLATTK